MSIKGVIRNVKNKGITETIRIRNENVQARKAFREYRKAFAERNFADLDGEKYAAFMKDIFEKEKELKKTYPKEFKIAKKEMKALYVKERIPAMYASLSAKPLEHKVIFMENGNSPSPSCYHLSKVMEQQCDYELHFTGLKIRQVSEIEYYENALRYVADLATAKAVFLSTANDILSHVDLRAETKVIQLWHGVGVFKKIGYSTADNQKFGKSITDRQEYDQYGNYTYVTIPSEEQAWIFEDAMHISRDSGKLAAIGVSRTDVFFDDQYIQETYDKLYAQLPQAKGKKIILYAPTFRGRVADAQAPDQLDIEAFGEALSEDYVLLIKHHGLSKNIPEIPDRWKDTFAFDMGENKFLGIERLLAIADICITDYSSIAFEYAIMERPLVFFAYDIDEYIDSRGMYYDYDQITPGPVCRTNGEMIDYIKDIDNRFNKQEIIDFKNKYVGMCDGHATERTIELIEGSVTHYV